MGHEHFIVHTTEWFVTYGEYGDEDNTHLPKFYIQNRNPEQAQ